MNNKGTTVITGASSGLGKCLCQSFSKSYNVINISRSISASKYNIITNLNDLSDLKLKLEMNKVKHDLCILNAGTMGNIGLALVLRLKSNNIQKQAIPLGLIWG